MSIANTSGLSFFVKVYISDNNNKWIDFTDRLSISTNRGVDKVIGIQSIKYTIEQSLGALQTTTQSILFDNSDDFFSKPFPSTLKTTDGNVASFSNSLNYSHSVLYRHKIKITTCFYDKDSVSGSASVDHFNYAPIKEVALGVFLIEGFSIDASKKIITFTLRGLESPLQEIDAAKIKDGSSWYQNKPVSFLITQLLKLYYMDTDGELPDTYNVSRVLNFNTVDGSLVISHFGRPPEWDGTTWRNDGLYCRALCWANLGSGGRLYLGCDDELWEWNPTTDTYTLINNTTVASYNPGAYIKKIIAVVISSVSYLYVFAWDDETNLSVDDDYDVLTNVSIPITICTYDGTSFVHKNTTTIYSGPIYSGALIDRIGNHFYTPWTTTYLSLGIGSGENIVIPFPQRIRAIFYAQARSTSDYYDATNEIYAANDDSKTIWSSITGLADTAIISTTNYHDVLDVTKPYTVVGLRSTDISGTANAPFTSYCRFSWGTPYQIGVSQYHGDNRFYWFYVVPVNMDSGGAATTMESTILECPEDGSSIADIQTGSHFDWTPICMGVVSSIESGRYIWISGMQWDNIGNSDPSDRSQCVTLRIDLSTNVASTLREFCNGESSGDLYWTIIEMICANGYIVGCLYNRKTKIYQLFYRDTDPIISDLYYSECTKYYQSMNQITRFHYDTASSKVYCYEVNVGRLLSFTPGSSNVTLEAFGDSAVEGDYNILSNLVSDTINGTVTAPIIYGISAPTNLLETQPNYPSGKYVLFRLSNALNDRIELADFSGKNCWAVIKELSQATSSICFFDENGNFNLKGRLSSISSADYSIGKFGNTVESILDLKVASGEKEIYNYVSLVPGAATYQLPDKEAITLIARGTNEYGTGVSSIPFVPYDIDQRDNLTKTAKAICTRGGTTTDGNARFKFTITLEVMSTYLVQNEGASETIYSVSSVYGGDNEVNGINIGDFAIVQNPTTGEDIYRAITAVSNSANTITLASTFGIALNRKDEIRILKSFRTSSGSAKAIWSDEGVAYLTATLTSGTAVATVNSVEGLSVSTMVKFKDGATYSEEFRIIAVNETDKQITLSANASSTINSAAVVLAWFSPYENASYPTMQEIGGSNVFIQFRTPSTGTAEVDYTKTFKVGDRVSINCPGITLEQDTSSKQVSIDVTSISLHGRKEFPSINNKFLSRNLCRELGKYYIDLYKDPKYQIDLVCNLTPDIKLVNSSGALSRVDLFSPDAFPFSAGGIQQSTIKSITHDIMHRKTTVTLKSLEAY